MRRLPPTLVLALVLLGAVGRISAPVFLACVVFAALVVGAVVMHGALFKRKVREREARVEAAADEAAQDDPAFAAATVRAEGRRLFLEAQAAWDAHDRERLRRIAGPELMTQWERRLDFLNQRGWHDRVSVGDDLDVHYVGLVNRERDEDDRAVVYISARLDT